MILCLLTYPFLFLNPFLPLVHLDKVPVAIGASGYEGYMLYTGKRKIASRGDAGADWKIHQLVFACFIGMCGGMVGGLLGLGGGFILGPLFLEMGIPPQVITTLLNAVRFIITVCSVFLGPSTYWHSTDSA